MLYVTEGDSAKALCVAGFSVVGRATNGVFSLRGKLMNVHGMSPKRAMESKEILYLIQILGLDPCRTYDAESVAQLPYKHLVGFTDQDDDGNHILGLLLNVFKTFFPSLLDASPSFVLRFATPLVKARVSGGAEHHFFSMASFLSWRAQQRDATVSAKYYKGLGTSTNQEAKDYFRAFDRHKITFLWTGEQCREAIDVSFNPKRSGERKSRLETLDRDAHVDYSLESVPIWEFCNSDLLQFSFADNMRNLPSAMDGLKPSQRKVLFTMLRQKSEIKVAQAAALTAHATAYHHGEDSLMQTIVSMAQRWVGANNINLLEPKGQFGDMHNKRTVHAAPRYIFTQANSVARALFRKEDDAVLKYAEDDGKTIEPIYYIPIVPTVLINGAEGIGTGWSTSIPCFLPEDVIKATKAHILGEEIPQLIPGFVGFAGRIFPDPPDQSSTFACEGVYQLSGDTIIITQLPPGRWTEAYKEWVQTSMMADAKQIVIDVTNHSTSDNTELHIRCQPDSLRGRNIVKEFRLSTTIHFSNMNMFNSCGALTRYNSPLEVITDHAKSRIALYNLRKEHDIATLKEAALLATNKARFVKEVVDGTCKPQTYSREGLKQYLMDSHYYPHNSFQYLFSLGMASMTKDAFQDLVRAAEEMSKEVCSLEKTDVKQIWLQEIEELLSCIHRYDSEAKEKDAASALKEDTQEKKKRKCK